MELQSAVILATSEPRRSKGLQEGKRPAPTGGTYHLTHQSNNSQGGVAKGTSMIKTVSQENLEEFFEREELLMLTAESIYQLL